MAKVVRPRTNQAVDEGARGGGQRAVGHGGEDARQHRGLGEGLLEDLAEALGSRFQRLAPRWSDRSSQHTFTVKILDGRIKHLTTGSTAHADHRQFVLKGDVFLDKEW